MCEKNTTHVRSVSPQIDPKPSPVALPSQTRLRVIAAWLAGGHGAMLTVNNGKEMPGQAPLDTVKLCMFGSRMGQPNSTLICRRLEIEFVSLCQMATALASRVLYWPELVETRAWW